LVSNLSLTHAVLGYEGFSQEQEFEDGFGGTLDVTFSGGGPRLAAVLAFKF
jgi:hypothetical protein